MQESTLLKDTLREAQGGDMGAIARAMSRLNKSQQPGAKEARLVWGVRCGVWGVRCEVWGGVAFSVCLVWCASRYVCS